MLDVIKNLLWNYMFIPLFLITGVICFIAFFTRKKEKTEKNSTGEVSPVQTLFVTLASTIGTGNIMGVGLAISVGGAGAVFWMWVAAIFGMWVSYTENSFGVKFKGNNNQPVCYMPKTVSIPFSFFCILSAFGIGNMIQANSAANALYTGFGVKSYVTGIVMSLLAFVIIKGGLKGITKFTDKFVPIMSVFYIVSALMVIFLNISNLGNVIKSIFSEAFSIKAITGGALATGIGRGVLSGEAGIGSTVILSGKSNAKSPHDQGVIGMTAIFIDTIVICSLTAFAILSASAQSTSQAFYKTLGSMGGIMLDLSIVFFAFTTIVGWSYFGLICTKYLFGEKWGEKYKLLYAVCTFIGAISALDVVWNIGDIASALMALPNLLCVIYLALKKPTV